MRNAGLVLIDVPFALIGGIVALHITGVNFGISAGVGFIALFGICVQNGASSSPSSTTTSRCACRWTAPSSMVFAPASAPW